MLVFAMLHRFAADDIQRRSDAWLGGEVEVLGDVAEHTPKDKLYGTVVSEIAELASKEVPNRERTGSAAGDSVFFLQTSRTGAEQLWVGAGDGVANLKALQRTKIETNAPAHLQVKGFEVPFRVASARLDDGSRIYLGLSERDELRVLRSMRVRFFSLWLLLVALGYAIVFFTTRRMLGRVRDITEAASRIGNTDLSSRVPTSCAPDEIGHLGLTLNHMLDRIESSMHQLHTITDALAHDLRSPLTAIRGKLETALTTDIRVDHAEPIVSAIDELDRLTEFLNTSLDVAEAKADALRLSLAAVDLDEVMRVMIDLYEPCMAERGIRMELRSPGAIWVQADAALLHRVVANLLDNEMKHLPESRTVSLRLEGEDDKVVLTVEDDGAGFDLAMVPRIFDQGVKGRGSSGHGLGLAFVAAVVRVHGGRVEATNRPQGGARLTICWPSSKHPEPTVGEQLALANR